HRIDQPATNRAERQAVEPDLAQAQAKHRAAQKPQHEAWNQPICDLRGYQISPPTSDDLDVMDALAITRWHIAPLQTKVLRIADLIDGKEPLVTPEMPRRRQ